MVLSCVRFWYSLTVRVTPSDIHAIGRPAARRNFLRSTQCIKRRRTDGKIRKSNRTRVFIIAIIIIVVVSVVMFEIQRVFMHSYTTMRTVRSRRSIGNGRNNSASSPLLVSFSHRLVRSRVLAVVIKTQHRITYTGGAYTVLAPTINSPGKVTWVWFSWNLWIFFRLTDGIGPYPAIRYVENRIKSEKVPIQNRFQTEPMKSARSHDEINLPL